MATTANKNCKQFIGIVTGEDGITARSGDEPGKGTVKLKTAEINESESTSNETVYQISETGSTDVEVFNQSDLTFAEGEEVQIWQDGYGVFWVTPVKDNREYFVINPGNDGTQTAVNDYSLYTKGSLHYIGYDSQSQIWVPITGNETAPTSAPYTRPSARLAICQVDAPASAKEFRMPYYTPESNMGVPPDVDSNNPYLNDYSFSTAEHRCGVVLGEHKFSGKNYDYFTDSSGKYGYQPNFLAVVIAQGNTGGWNNPYIVLNGEQIDIRFNTSYLYGPSCPDIYPYDSITIEFCVNAPYQWAIDYPRDYPAGTYMAFYQSPGRGWVADATPQGMQDAGLTLYHKDKTGAIT